MKDEKMKKRREIPVTLVQGVCSTNSTRRVFGLTHLFNNDVLCCKLNSITAFSFTNNKSNTISFHHQCLFTFIIDCLLNNNEEKI